MIQNLTETVRIGMVSRGDPGALDQLKSMMRVQEAMGHFSIVSMDDDVAVIAWRDMRVAATLSTERGGRA